MEKEVFLKYESPTIEVIEVEVENGFVVSTSTEGFLGEEQL